MKKSTFSKGVIAALESDRRFAIVPDRWYSIKEAAYLLFVNRSTIYSFIKRMENPLKVKRIGSHNMVLGDHLISFRNHLLTNSRNIIKLSQIIT